MSFKYFVTLCASDQDAGSNFFWHSRLLISRYDTETKRMEVIDNWGFNGLPVVDKTSWLYRFTAYWANLKVDLTGNHGVLCREEYRYLDRGCGLHGYTFELTETQLNNLQSRCTRMVSDQQQAVEEAVQAKKLQEKPAHEVKFYAYEHEAQTIYFHEKQKAREQGREPRLKQFAFPLVSGLSGPPTNTCKTQIIDLLTGILTDEQIAKITYNGWLKDYPRFCGDTEDMYLYTEGTLTEHTTKEGEKSVYRDNMKPHSDVKLYWTLPPQVVDTIEPETKELFTIDADYCSKVKAITKKLQRLEWLFLNANLQAEDFGHRLSVLTYLSDYKKLFKMALENKSKPAKDWYTSTMTFFGLTQDSQERKWEKMIKDAELNFNNLYQVVAGDIPFREYSTERFECAALLSDEDKKKMCGILGYSYCEADHNLNVLG